VLEFDLLRRLSAFHAARGLVLAPSFFPEGNHVTASDILEIPASALPEQPLEARCVRCGIQEFVVALDGPPLDAAFFANYLCDECESLATG
jgi:hypothetical protein